MKPPPYDLSKIKPPLTKVQKAAILAWYLEVTGVTLRPTIKDTDLLYVSKSVASGKGEPLANTVHQGGIDDALNSIQAPVTGAAGSAITAIKSVTDFLQLLTDPHLWVRVGEIVIGGTLIIVGIGAVVKGNINTSNINTGR